MRTGDRMAKYVVVGRHVVHGHEPGESFDAEPSTALSCLVAAGHIALAPKEAPPVPPTPDTSGEATPAKEA